MNRGSDKSCCLTSLLKIASMRPRFMNRGSPPGRTSTNAACCSFNEAPIHESGKSLDSRAARNTHPCRFNEAPIHESGKCQRKR